MRKAIALAILLVSNTSKASDWSWTWPDYVMEGAFVATVAIDRAQTLTPGFQENGPFAGFIAPNGRIDKTRLDIACVSSIIIHAGISAALPKPWREVWQGTSLAIEIVNVQGNFSTGARLAWKF